MLTHRIIRTIPSGTTTAAGSNLAGIDRVSSDHGMASARDPVLDACGLRRPFGGRWQRRKRPGMSFRGARQRLDEADGVSCRLTLTQ